MPRITIIYEVIHHIKHLYPNIMQFLQRKGDPRSSSCRFYNDFNVYDHRIPTLSLGILFFSYPHFLANFIAVSTPSAPVFIGRTISYPNMLVRNSANTGNLSLWKALELTVSLSTCSSNAFFTFGWQCPCSKIQ